MDVQGSLVPYDPPDGRNAGTFAEDLLRYIFVIGPARRAVDHGSKNLPPVN